MEEQKDGRTDGTTDRPYFIGPFRLPPGVQLNIDKIIIPQNSEGNCKNQNDLEVYTKLHHGRQREHSPH